MLLTRFLPRHAMALMALMLLSMMYSIDARADLRYRVELLVFRNLFTDATPMVSDEPRRFHQALSLDEPTPQQAPQRLDKLDGTFANIWRRLDRLEDYQPITRLTWEQSVFDYHPPVRIHDEQVMASELHFPGPVVYIDLTDRRTERDLFEDFHAPLYRLDGTAQLRRSRFLHLDLDLEYRLDGPAWDRLRAEESSPVERVEFQDSGTADRESRDETDMLQRDDSMEPLSGGMITQEPFQVHRLQQSRQIKTNTMQYFDSAFLGAIVRVTPIADDGS